MPKLWLSFLWQLMPLKLITLTLLNATTFINQYDTTKILLTDLEIINKSDFSNLTRPLQNAFAIGNVANSKRPLSIIPKVQLRLRVTRKSATALARYLQKLAKLFAGKNFVKNLVTAQTQLRSYSEQQRAFGNSNICNYLQQ